MTLTNLQLKQKPTQSLKLGKTLVKKASSSPSNCRFCQFYKFESRGQSRGYCCKLRVSVYGHWHSCRLALPPFAPSWEKANEEIFR
jgi:hypothetical protein